VNEAALDLISSYN